MRRRKRERTKVYKIKTPKISKLKKKLWTLFSIYIRYRDKGVCFTCGLKKQWKEMQAGHFISRAIGGILLYFHERNVHCQCFRCNINLGGNGAIYAKRLKERYGQEALDELYTLQQTLAQWTPQDYLDKIEHYKNLIKEMGIK